MEDYAAQARVFKAFCDVNRLQILELLRSGEKCASSSSAASCSARSGAAEENAAVSRSSRLHSQPVSLSNLA